MEKGINVLYQANEAFVIPLGVSIISLLENNKEMEKIEINILDDGIEEDSKKHLSALISRYYRTLRFIDGQKIGKMLKELGIVEQQQSGGGYTTFFKIFCSSLLENLNEILYIDADTIILDSLQDLANYDLTGYACAMVESAMSGEVKRYLDVVNYFNAGVIYINFNYWKENEIDKKLAEAIKSEERFKITLVGDESLINVILKGEILKLPLKYNYESSWWLWGWNRKLYEKLGWNNEKACPYSNVEITQSFKKPIIVHYINLTTGRPWDFLNDSPFRYEFRKYLAMLNPWKSIIIPNNGIGGNSKLITLLKWLFKKVLCFSMRSRLGYKQHEAFWKGRIEEEVQRGKR